MGKRDVTRLVMLRTAERLFAERGVDNVSLRELAAAAGQRNHSAALYHFGDKRALLEALLDRHSGPADASFEPAIARLRAEGREDLEQLVRVLVAPMVAKLEDEDGGAPYLQICAELVSSQTFPLTGLRAANGPGAQALTQRLVAHMVDPSPMLQPIRMMRTAAVLFCSLAACLRLRAAGLFISQEEFTEDLVHALVASLSPRGTAKALSPSQPTPRTRKR